MILRASRAVPSSLRVCSLSVAPSKLNNVSDSPLTVRV